MMKKLNAEELFYCLYDSKMGVPLVFIKKVYNWIIKSFQYSLLLWKDFDWDYHYILILLQYKLKRTRICIVENDMIVDAKKVGAEIQYAEDLIELIINDNFCEEEHDAHTEKWGEPEFMFDPIPERKGLSRLQIRHEHINTPKDERQYREESIAIHKLSDERREKALDDLFLHLRNKLQGWWD